MAKKKTKAERETLHVALLVDESGSMGHMHGAVIAGVNEFINDLKADPSKSTRILASLAMFDLVGGEPPVRVHFSDLPLRKVRMLGPSDYAPRGSTPLNDAVSRTIGALEKLARPKSGKKKTDRVMIVILTDGLENASETTSAELRKLIHAKEADGWEFVYLGANQDTWAATEGIGLAQRGKHFAWEASAGGVSAALKVSGDRVKRFRDAPAEYRAEADLLSDRIAPGEAKARLLTKSERRNARRRR
jgi:uncharacterized protein YegL